MKTLFRKYHGSGRFLVIISLWERSITDSPVALRRRNVKLQQTLRCVMKEDNCCFRSTILQQIIFDVEVSHVMV